MVIKIVGGLALGAALVAAGFSGTSDKTAADAPVCEKGTCCSKDCCKDCPDCNCECPCCDNCEDGCECPNKP